MSDAMAFHRWSRGDANDIDGSQCGERAGANESNALQIGRLRSIATAARFGIILDQSIRHAVGVFSEDAFAFNAVDVARSFVIAGLNTSEHVFAVHDVRLAVHDRATVNARGEQIARIHVTAGTDFGRAVRGGICDTAASQCRAPLPRQSYRPAATPRRTRDSGAAGSFRNVHHRIPAPPPDTIRSTSR